MGSIFFFTFQIVLKSFKNDFKAKKKIFFLWHFCVFDLKKNWIFLFFFIPLPLLLVQSLVKQRCHTPLKRCHTPLKIKNELWFIYFPDELKVHTSWSFIIESVMKIHKVWSSSHHEK